MLPWLASASDPYDAQDRLRAELDARPLDAVARELARALVSPELPAATRGLAAGLVGGMVDDLEDLELLVSLVVHLGPSGAEPPDAALAALARSLVRAPDDPRLHEAIRAAARRSRQRRYDARHGLDVLERAVRAGEVDRGVVGRFAELVERPDPPSPEALLLARAAVVYGEAEVAALVAEHGSEPLARAFVAAGGAVSPDAPEASRLASVASTLRATLAASPLRGALALVEARLRSRDPQVAVSCALCALADDASLAKPALAFVRDGLASAPDSLDDDELRGVCARAGLDAGVTKKVLAAAAKGRKAAL